MREIDDDDDDDEPIKPDQDHDFMLKEDHQLQRAKLLSLEIDLKEKDKIIEELKHELDLAKIEATEYEDRVQMSWFDLS